jgi:isopenicillin-N epimerase
VIPAASKLSEHWAIDPSIVFLNHGSFGATPRIVLDAQTELRSRMERNSMQFFLRDLECLLDEARTAVGRFVDAKPDDLAFIPNATTGVNAVLRSLDFAPGDELLVTDHEYNACRNVLDYAAARASAKVVVAPLPFPLLREDAVVEAIVAKVTPRTKLLLVDHVTSPTGLVLPVARIAAELAPRGIDVLIDGAHAPGMVDLSLERLSPHVPFYTANCHKWLCAPKGAAFLWVRKDRQRDVRPHVISHGANSPRTDRSHFLLEFDWAGTVDPTAVLCIGKSIEVLQTLDPAFRETNRSLTLEARKILCDALGVAPPSPASMIGSLAAIPIPDGDNMALQDALFREHRIEVPIMPWPASPKRLVRVSAQLYNTREQYAYLAKTLIALIGRAGGSR